MTHKNYPYDPDLPYVVATKRIGGVYARFKHMGHANEFVGAHSDFEVIDTTPAPRVPEDARFITWRVQGNDRWYAEREGDAWCTDDAELFGAVEDLPDVTPDTVFTVLEERKQS